MLAVLRLLIAAAIGAVVGLGSVWLALTDPRLDLGRHVGVWRIMGAPRDPYAAARMARAGALPLGAAEGVAFVARTDEGGRPLDPRCHYEIAGPVPAADLWTLAVTDLSGRLPVNPAGRIGFTSQDALGPPDGGMAVVVGPTVRPGNFVPTAGLASMEFTLRIYAPRLAADLPAREGMPAVRLAACPGGPRA